MIGIVFQVKKPWSLDYWMLKAMTGNKVFLRKVEFAGYEQGWRELDAYSTAPLVALDVDERTVDDTLLREFQLVIDEKLLEQKED